MLFYEAHQVFTQAKEIFPQKAVQIINVMAVTFYGSWSLHIFTWFLSPTVRPRDGAGACSTCPLPPKRKSFQDEK